MLYFADNDFKLTEKNPFTNEPYNDNWLMYELTDSHDYEFFCGKVNGSIYCIRASKYSSNWQMSLGDFIDFNKEKNIILVMNRDEYKQSLFMYSHDNCQDGFLRKYESKVLVHSTTFDNWCLIKNDNLLKSFNSICNNFSEPIGKLLGDPNEFQDYIMFSNGNVSGEIVVASKENNKISMDVNTPYITGARLYFDARKIAEDGLLIRDGIHMKVKDELPLYPYLLWVATYKNTGLKSRVSTPKEFTEKSNSKFCEMFKEYGSCF